MSIMSGCQHGACLYYWDYYTSNLAKGLQRFRWFEYSFSASIIMTLLFALWGNLDFVQTSGCFVLNMCTMYFGDMHEVLNQGCSKKEVNWSAFWYGAFTGIAPWCVMIYEM